MIVPFKYKLTFLIACIILLVLGGTFYQVQTNLEQKFTLSIENDLKKTRLIIGQLMLERRRSIAASATILQGNPLLREILTDRGLDRLTAEDIVEEEILSDFPDLSLLLIADSDGDLLAAKGVDASGIDFIRQHALYQRILNGKRGLAYLFQNDVGVQIIGMPVFLREELIGVMVVGSPLTQTVVNKIKAMSGADLALFRDNTIFLASDWQVDKADKEKTLAAIAPVISAQKRADPQYADPRNPPQPELIYIQNERWLYTLVHDRRGFLPDYLLAKSLDSQLAFVDDIRQDTLIIAAVALFIAVLFSFLFSLGISRPIVALKRATDAVELEDFSYRTHIKSRDEFEQLGSAFNLMIEGLEERESMRGLMNRLMSKQVVDHLLEGDIEVDGEVRQVSCLWLYLDGFDQFADGMTAKALLQALNDCFTRTGFCIDAHQGVINRYEHYACLAMFGVPVSQAQHSAHAFQAALDIIEAIAIFNGENPGHSAIQAKIALASGAVIAGHIGAENRMSYNIIGEPLVEIKALLSLLMTQNAVMAINQSAAQALDTEQLALLQTTDSVTFFMPEQKLS